MTKRESNPPPIIVMAYNRPEALKRLLTSLSNGVYHEDVLLVIVVDEGGEHSAAVRQLATDFDWPFGHKELRFQTKPHGLFDHFLFCGDLSAEFGHLILLEDDLFVSPYFYQFVETVRNKMGRLADKVAGLSLSGPWFNGFTHTPFQPLEDGGSTYYLQVAWYHGQYYTADQWAKFRDWLASPSAHAPLAQPMHELFETFPESDWFPVKTRYLVATDRYYLFPRTAYATNFGDMGTHFAQGTRFFQRPLQWGETSHTLHPWEESLAVYDSFQEILPDRLNRLTNQFSSYQYSVDLNGIKSTKNIKQEHVLTTKESRAPQWRFGDLMHPLEANVIAKVPGQQISFGKTADLKAGWPAQAISTWRRYNHHQRGRKTGQRTRLTRLFGRLLDQQT